MNLPKNVELLNISITTLTKKEFLELFDANLKAGKRYLLGYANIYGVNLAWERASFRDALKRFDIVFCDGFGVMLGARLSGQIIPERYTPPDFIDELMKILVSQGGSLFLLGAAPGVAERAAITLQQHTPGLQIAGCAHGYFDKTTGSAENNAILEQINASHPALLLVGFGMPLQEEWLIQNWPGLDIKMALTIGAAFDTLAGIVPRGPRWLTDHGLEWLSRLVMEPRRLWRRYLIGNPLFFWRVIAHHWLKIT